MCRFLAAIVAVATVYIAQQVRTTVRQAYDAGRVTGYAQGTLERR